MKALRLYDPVVGMSQIRGVWIFVAEAEMVPKKL